MLFNKFSLKELLKNKECCQRETEKERDKETEKGRLNNSLYIFN
jgi:hypothetical protein